MNEKYEHETEQHWVKAYDSVIRAGWLKPNEIAVYMNLLSHQGINPTAWPSHETIGEEVGIHSRTVARTIKKLEAKKLVEVLPRFEENGRQTSNAYRVKRVPIAPALGRPPGGTKSDKEDSSQEDLTNTSTKVEVRNDWSYLSDTKPPTAKQLDYIADLIMDVEECTPDEAWAHIDELSVPTQKAAGELIRDLYVAAKSIEAIGHSGCFELYPDPGELYPDPGGIPLPPPSSSPGAVSPHTGHVNSESTPDFEFAEVW
jgi:predicted transcriptional regulator